MAIHLVKILADPEKRSLLIRSHNRKQRVDAPERFPNGNLQLLEPRGVPFGIDIRPRQTFHTSIYLRVVLAKQVESLGKMAFVHFLTDLLEFRLAQIRHQLGPLNWIRFVFEAGAKVSGPILADE
jgi:hypothetical protein